MDVTTSTRAAAENDDADGAGRVDNPPLPPATPEEMCDRLHAAGFAAPAVTEVLLPGADAPEQALTTEEYLGWIVAGLGALQHAPLLATLRKVLPPASVTKTLLSDCHKAWKARLARRLNEMQEAPSDSISPALRTEAERLKLRSDAAIAAAPVLEEADPLGAAFDLAHKLFGIVGSRDVFGGSLLASVSALLERPAAVSVQGESASGKSFPSECALCLLPPSEVSVTTGSSPRALVYRQGDIRHRTLYLSDANSLLRASTDEDPNVGANLLRSLLSEGRLAYETVAKDERGTLRTVNREVPGPIAVIACMSSGKMDWDTATRMLPLPADGSSQQTSAVLDALAARYEAGDPAIAPLEAVRRDPALQAAVEPWRAYFIWLATHGPTRVTVPFAQPLRSFLAATQPRVKRDLAGLLGMVQAHALLNRPRRTVDARGRLEAKIEDYAAVRSMLTTAFSRASGNDLVGVQALLPVLRGLALLARRAADADDMNDLAPRRAGETEWPDTPVKVSGRVLARAITEATGQPITDKTALAQLRRAMDLELVERTDNAWGGGGRMAGVYRISEPPPVTEATEVTVLPTPDEVEARWADYAFGDWNYSVVL